MLPLKSENGETLMTCRLQRLLKHFGYGQGAACMTGGSCINVWDVESCYVGEGRDTLLGPFLPSFGAREGVKITRMGAPLDEVHRDLYQLRCFEQSRTSSV